VSRFAAERRGHKGERLAALWLQLKGCASSPVVCALRSAKSTSSPGAAARSPLSRNRLHRVAAAANAVMARYVRTGDVSRIDAVFILPGRLPRHLPDVWQG